MSDVQRHQELADFLRTRRARVSPARAGLASGSRRRTPGLRREEVAELAAVGLTWYTWLEQGRDVHASTQVVESIARALQLDPAERAHLFMLAKPGKPCPPQPDETVHPALQRLLDQLEALPAYIMGRRWDVLAWNRAACLVFEDYTVMPAQERNCLWRIFTSPYLRRLRDWECTAQRALAQFRVSAGRYAGDPSFAQLIDDLRRASPEFEAWWPRHDVRDRTSVRKELDHPVAGRLVLEQSTFQVEDATDQKLVIYAPLPEADSTAKIARLLAASTAPAHCLRNGEFAEEAGHALQAPVAGQFTHVEA